MKKIVSSRSQMTEAKDACKSSPKEEKLADFIPEQYVEEVDDEMKQKTEDIDIILSQFNKGTESISLRDFPMVMKALDQNPAENEIKEYTETYGKINREGASIIHNTAVHEIIRRWLKDPDTEEVLREAFMIITNEKGELTYPDFIHMMTTRGNPVNEDVVQAYIQYADTNKDGLIEINDFVQLLMSTKR